MSIDIFPCVIVFACINPLTEAPQQRWDEKQFHVLEVSKSTIPGVKKQAVLEGNSGFYTKPIGWDPRWADLAEKRP